MVKDSNLKYQLPPHKSTIMQKIISLFIICLFSISALMAQSIPQGINYQAVARNAKGEVIANLPITLKISLLTNLERTGQAYSEIHEVTTNKLGLFNIVIGEGEAQLGTFKDIPWATEEIWIEIAMDEQAGENFKVINTTRLLTVPYAFHAGSAAELVPIQPDGGSRVPWWGQPWWNIEGLEKTDPDIHFVGNIDSTDLVFRTNDLERLRIKANGEIVMPGDVEIGGTLEVKGDSTIVKNLYVQGDEAIIDGTLSVAQDVDFGANLMVANNIDAGGNITAIGDGTFNNLEALNDARIGNNLQVNGPTNLNSTLEVTETSDLKGQVTIDATVGGGAASYDAHPLRVQGSDQGIAIKVNAGTPTNGNNFVTFFNNSNTAVGRIEGETLPELLASEEYIQEKGALDLAVTLATIDVTTGGVAIALAAADLTAASTSSTACAGAGACVTSPIPSLIAAATANQIAVIADEISIAVGLSDAIDQRDFFESNAAANIGVTYQSGSGDYAEWLPKANPEEQFTPGYIVGMKNGRISLNTESADQLFAISTKPIVLGNMPDEGTESQFEKVAFMGQVPVHVTGKVNPGDYILPSGFNNGFGRAVAPENMSPEDYTKIVGVAWSASQNDAYSLINVAIGLNAGDVSRVVAEQQREIESLKKAQQETQALLARLVPGYAEAVGIKAESVEPHQHATPPTTIAHEDVHFITPDASNVVYFEPTREQLLEGLALAEQLFVDGGGELSAHPFWSRMQSDMNYREAVIDQLEVKLKKSMHMHKEINK